jgi:hypothetical protein
MTETSVSRDGASTRDGVAPAVAERNAALLASDAEHGAAALTDPGLVTVAGDWHGDFEFAAEVIDAAPAGPSGASGARTVLQLGDFGVWPGPPGAGFLDRLAGHLRARNAVLLFVDGNHEDHPQLLGYPLRPDGLRVLRPRLYHLPRGFRWCWHGRTWLALGGAHSIDRGRRTAGVDWWPGETITAEDVERAMAGGQVDYMVTHDCPAGISIPTIRDPVIGQPKDLFEELAIEAEYRRVLRDVVTAVRPAQLLHGHYHVRHEAWLDLGGGRTCRITGMGKTSSVADNMLTLDLTVGGGQPRSAGQPGRGDV